MKKTKAQQKADEAFIEKLKSINIGGKPLGEHACPVCHEPLGEHTGLKGIEIKIVPIPVPAGFFSGGNPANN